MVAPDAGAAAGSSHGRHPACAVLLRSADAACDALAPPLPQSLCRWGGTQVVAAHLRAACRWVRPLAPRALQGAPAVACQCNDTGQVHVLPWSTNTCSRIKQQPRVVSVPAARESARAATVAWLDLTAHARRNYGRLRLCWGGDSVA